ASGSWSEERSAGLGSRRRRRSEDAEGSAGSGFREGDAGPDLRHVRGTPISSYSPPADSQPISVGTPHLRPIGALCDLKRCSFSFIAILRSVLPYCSLLPHLGNRSIGKNQCGRIFSNSREAASRRAQIGRTMRSVSRERSRRAARRSRNRQPRDEE